MGERVRIPGPWWHVLGPGEEEGLVAGGSVPVAPDGVVHLCTADQLEGVLERWFGGHTGLRAARVDPDRLADRGDVAVELVEVYPGEVFPHLRGPLPATAVVEIVDLPLSPEEEPPPRSAG